MKHNENVRTATFVLDGTRVYVEVDMLRMAKFVGRRAAGNKTQEATACLGAVEAKIVTEERAGRPVGKAHD